MPAWRDHHCKVHQYPKANDHYYKPFVHCCLLRFSHQVYLLWCRWRFLELCHFELSICTQVNESGAEFGNANIPGQLGKDYTWPSPSSIDYFVGKGMNTFRVALSVFQSHGMLCGY
jgi:hypothetical protein